MVMSKLEIKLDPVAAFEWQWNSSEHVEDTLHYDKLLFLDAKPCATVTSVPT